MRTRRGWGVVTFALVAALAMLGPQAATSDGDDGSGGGGSASSSMSADQLQKLVAPVALYPDKLLSNVLRAATVPIQIVQADRYLDKKSSGGDADESQTKNWDPSVQALLHYPKVVKQMSDKLDWTTELGQAVIGQQKDVTKAVQADRARAVQQDALTSNDQVKVTTQPAPGGYGSGDGGDSGASSDDGGDDGSANSDAGGGADGGAVYYGIQSIDPSVVYVPTYDPAFLYPGYRGTGAAVAWGAGMATGAWLAGGFHWGSGDITVNRNVTVNGYRTNVWHHPDSLNQAWRRGAQRPASWQHAGQIGSFGDPRGRYGSGASDAARRRQGGAVTPRADGAGARRDPGRQDDGFGDRDGRFGSGGFNGGSAGSHFGQMGGDGFGGHGRSAFSGMGGGGFEDHAAARGGFSRGGFGGGGFRGGRRR